MTSEVQLTIANFKQWETMAIAEMIMSLSHQRRLFPVLKFNVSGLNPDKFYKADIVVERVDDFKYAFKNGQWCQWSNSPIARPAPQWIAHEDGFKSGTHWMAESIDFSKLMITVKKANTDTTLLLAHMHMYQPKLVLTTDDVQYVFCDPIQCFIPVSNMSPRLKMLKKLCEEPQTKKPVQKRKRSDDKNSKEPKSKKKDIALVSTDVQSQYVLNADTQCIDYGYVQNPVSESEYQYPWVQNENLRIDQYYDPVLLPYDFNTGNEFIQSKCVELSSVNSCASFEHSLHSDQTSATSVSSSDDSQDDEDDLELLSTFLDLNPKDRQFLQNQAVNCFGDDANTFEPGF